MAINVKDKLVTVESLGIAYSTEQGARQEADQALSTRIDNIVAPDGDPSLTEVSDARVSGSTTHNTLKARLDADQAAIETEISGINESMDDIKTQVGDLSELETSEKSSLVGAINEAAQSGGSEITVDDTLTTAGAAADAKKTGDEISEIKADLANNVNDLKNTITNVTGYKAISFTNGKYIKTNLNVGDLVDLTPVTGYNTNNYAIVDAQEGDKFTINATGGKAGRLWCFVDSNNVLLSVAVPGAIATKLVLTAPANASKLILNPVSGYGKIYKGEYLVDVTNGLENHVNALNTSVGTLAEELNGVRADVGDLSNLDTTDKSSIVAAINEAAQSGGGGAVVITNSSEMENASQIYLYEGTETGYTAGHFYYNNGSAWVDGGQYYVGRDGRNGQDGADGQDGRDGVNGHDGADGQDGQDGFSPIATVEATSTGVRISITDKTGTTSATVQNGTATDTQVAAWLEAHPEATTTVQDGTISKSKLAGDVLEPVNDVSTIKRVIGNDIISAISAFDNITWATGYFYPTTGAITGNSSYRYTEEYFDVNIIRFVKKCSLQTKNISSVVFYDGDKEIVGVIDTTSNGGVFVVTSIPVPQDAVYFRLCQIATNINPLPITFCTLEELFAKSETDLPVDIQSVLTSQGGIYVDGNLLTYKDWKVTDYIKVAPGMLLKYSGCGNIGGNATLCPIAFYDSDKNPILVIRPTESRYVSIYNNGWANDSAIGTSLNFGFIFTPPAACYCRLSGYRQLAPTLTVATIEPWAGKKCVFFGDSITYGVGTVEKYCNFLAMLRGITVANYAANGSILVTNGMDRVTAFATDYADKDVDAFIFAYGTNDWGNNKPLGEWYTTDSNGVRTLSTDTTTFRGAWVQILTYLKTNFDGKKIILMTPIHRGTGSYASDLTRNTIGLYLEDYVNVIKEAGEIFSVDVIDLYGESGLTPDINPNTAYFTGNDRLHPNQEGHKQMARVISSKLNTITID